MRRARRNLRRRALIAFVFTGLLMLAALGIVLRIGQTLAGGRRRALRPRARHTLERGAARLT